MLTGLADHLPKYVDEPIDPLAKGYGLAIKGSLEPFHKIIDLQWVIHVGIIDLEEQVR